MREAKSNIRIPSLLLSCYHTTLRGSFHTNSTRLSTPKVGLLFKKTLETLRSNFQILSCHGTSRFIRILNDHSRMSARFKASISHATPFYGRFDQAPGSKYNPSPLFTHLVTLPFLRRQHAEKLIRLCGRHLFTGDFQSLESANCNDFAVVVITKVMGGSGAGRNISFLFDCLACI